MYFYRHRTKFNKANNHHTGTSLPSTRSNALCQSKAKTATLYSNFIKHSNYNNKMQTERMKIKKCRKKKEYDKEKGIQYTEK